MRTKYRYLGCVDGEMLWESVSRLPGDSRVEWISCGWNWFWGTR